MNPKHLIAAALLATLPAASLPAETRFSADHAALLQQGLTTTADDFILPGYRAYAEATNGLTGALRAYCEGSAGVAPVHAAFADSFLAWQRIGIVQVGPVMAGEGPMRVQLWPDPKDFTRRAVRMAVNAEDPSLLEEGALEGRSIALVNLSALEDLIYPELAPGSYDCALAGAISAYQAALAGSFVAAWTPGADFRTAYDTAVEGNARYASVDDLIRELLAGVVVHSDRLRKFKIQRGLGDAPGETHPERTEAVESGLGLASIAAGFRALADLYELPYGFFDMTPELSGTMEFYMLGETAGSIADSLALETRSLPEIAAEDGEMAEQLRGFGELTLYHETYLKTGLPQSIGLTTGFTSADGD